MKVVPYVRNPFSVRPLKHLQGMISTLIRELVWMIWGCKPCRVMEERASETQKVGVGDNSGGLILLDKVYMSDP